MNYLPKQQQLGPMFLSTIRVKFEFPNILMDKEMQEIFSLCFAFLAALYLVNPV